MFFDVEESRQDQNRPSAVGQQQKKDITMYRMYDRHEGMNIR